MATSLRRATQVKQRDKEQGVRPQDNQRASHRVVGGGQLSQDTYFLSNICLNHSTWFRIAPGAKCLTNQERTSVAAKTLRSKLSISARTTDVGSP